MVEPEFVARAQQGDRAAAQRVLSGLYPSVRKHIDFLTGFGSDAEDLAQEALLEIWRALPSYRGDASLKTWALKIAGRRAQRLRWRLFRKERGRVDLELAYDVPEDHRAELVHLARVLERLDPKKREAFVLMEVQELTAEEAAEVVGVPANTVASRCRHAKAELRELLRPEKSTDALTKAPTPEPQEGEIGEPSQ